MRIRLQKGQIFYIMLSWVEILQIQINILFALPDFPSSSQILL